MSVQEVLMTPTLAVEFLKRNTCNRPLSGHHVKFLSKEMTTGRWKRNGDTICVSNNRLIDGQHRLHAIVASGITIPVLVVDGLDDDVFDTKDCGRRRTAADALAISGEKHHVTLASTIVFVDRYLNGQIDSHKRLYSTVEIEELLKKYGNAIRESVEYCHDIGTKRLVANSVMAGLHYIFSGIDKELANSFWSSLIGGHDLDEKSPVFILRERLVANTMAKGRLKPEYVAALCIRAWNRLRDGVPSKTLRWRENGRSAEAFPIAK